MKTACYAVTIRISSNTMNARKCNSTMYALLGYNATSVRVAAPVFKYRSLSLGKFQIGWILTQPMLTT